MSSQILASAIENMNSTGTPIDATGNRLRLKDGERHYPKSWSARVGSLRDWEMSIQSTRLVKMLQKITEGTIRATEAWTDGRHAVDDKCVELEHELAVALATVTEGAARSTVLKIAQVEPSHGFVAWQSRADDYAPKSSNAPAKALQPILATPERRKDAKELTEKLTAWSLKVAEYEHQFKVIDEAQKMSVVREMMPKDIQREFLTGPRQFDEFMEKLEKKTDQHQ